MQKQDNLIREAVMKAIIAEAEKNKIPTPHECDKLINDIRGKLVDLVNKLIAMGIEPSADILSRIKNMNYLLADIDPVEKNLAKYFKNSTEDSAAAIVGEEDNPDLKMSSDSDDVQQKKVVDMSKKYGMDIELTD